MTHVTLDRHMCINLMMRAKRRKAEREKEEKRTEKQERETQASLFRDERQRERR